MEDINNLRRFVSFLITLNIIGTSSPSKKQMNKMVRFYFLQGNGL
jgi:hypothetical protein